MVSGFCGGSREMASIPSPLRGDTGQARCRVRAGWLLWAMGGGCGGGEVVDPSVEVVEVPTHARAVEAGRRHPPALRTRP